MRILYDGYIFEAQEKGGISKYLTNVIRRLPPDWRPILREGDGATYKSVAHPELRTIRFPLSHWQRPRVLARRLREAYYDCYDAITSFDLVHSTYHFRLPDRPFKKPRKPLVATVFDMIPERFSKVLDVTGAEAAAKKVMIEAADILICISENTKAELQTRYRIPDGRIVVTPLAADLSIDMSYGKEPVPNSPYLLFIGNRGIYKNFARTLLAFQKVTQSWPHLTLCLIGQELHDSEIELVHALKLEDRIKEMGFISDEHLARLYRCSEALVYPSLQEGFGIPPLEAMACGTVVITSNRSSLPEVVGDTAIMIEPESVDEIAEAMLSLRDLGADREKFIQGGLERARCFNWDKTVEKTLEAYRSLAA
jgi:glycosyltransferase involved in cell wall biosynthesis